MNEILIIIITVVFITSPAIVKSRFSVLSDFSRYIMPNKMPKAEGMRAKRLLNITDIMLTIPQSKEITAKFFNCFLFFLLIIIILYVILQIVFRTVHLRGCYRNKNNYADYK